MKKYFCWTCKQHKLDYLFFNTNDIKIRQNFLRDKNNKAICYDCILNVRLSRRYKYE
ncbi:hypothetical protein [Spiroplasma endosymbiont of Aleiodes alternator]|uniref:hypothetical protein n=1 Tax=Spiroplasma endosymbiont of Aleiodes alternator TaxID=3139329 RepID=UPI003CCACA96